MSIDTTLTRLIDMLRVAARISLNPAHNADDRAHQVMLLQLEQERLWEDYDWPHLRVEVDIPAQAGQRYYDPPESVRVDRIEKIEFFSDGRWHPMQMGIDSAHFSAWNSDLDERNWPIRRWPVHNAREIEVWPILDRNANPTTLEGMMRVTGIRNLRPLVDEAHRTDLDDQMLVNYVAAVILAGKGSKDAAIRQQQADARYARLRGRSVKSEPFQLFGVGETVVPKRLSITQYRPPGT